MHRRLDWRFAVGALLLLILIGLAAARFTRPAVEPPSPTPPAGTSGAAPTAPPHLANRGSITSGNVIASNPGGGLPTLPVKPQPPRNTYQGCPAQGDGGDPELNILKNRTDAAPWYPVSVGSILALKWPQSLERHDRANWSASDRAAVAQYEGIPVQIEGWLAGAKAQGPESCNCHSPDDVDNHLWVVDDPSKDRAQSVVVEITPRVRAQHPGWAFDRVRPLVDGRTRVRISGWLLLDQEHPDQVGKTRGTIWEIHPIIAFDFQRGNQWIALDTGRVSTTVTNPGATAAPPTEDPSLPPPIVETPGPGFLPTATARPPQGTSGGLGASAGPVQIVDISYKGTGQSQPDEYVEIANTGPDPIPMNGWVLHDIYGGQDFTWQQFTIKPGQHVRVYTNQVHPDTGGFSFGSRAAIWNNTGDAAELLDDQGNVVSTFAYGNRR